LKIFTSFRTGGNENLQKKLIKNSTPLAEPVEAREKERNFSTSVAEPVEARVGERKI